MVSISRQWDIGRDSCAALLRMGFCSRNVTCQQFPISAECLITNCYIFCTHLKVRLIILIDRIKLGGFQVCNENQRQLNSTLMQLREFKGARSHQNSLFVNQSRQLYAGGYFWLVLNFISSFGTTICLSNSVVRLRPLRFESFKDDQ
jgi:hypothetical protein